jgi:hypothetical protein
VTLAVWMILLVQVEEASLICQYGNAEILILFVKDTFIGVLNPLVISDFKFISMKTIYYFSYVMKNALFSCQLY